MPSPAPRIRTSVQPGLDASHQWEELTTLVDHAQEIISLANWFDPIPARSPLDERAMWQPTLEAAGRSLTVDHPTPEIDHGLA